MANSYEQRRLDPNDHWDLGVPAAITGWNKSVQVAKDFLRSNGHQRMLILVYEWFYSGDRRQLSTLERFLGVDPDDDILDRYTNQTKKGLERMARGWPSINDQVESISERFDWETAEFLRLAAAEQLFTLSEPEDGAGWAGPDALSPPDDLLAVTGTALRSRILV